MTERLRRQTARAAAAAVLLLAAACSGGGRFHGERLLMGTRFAIEVDGVGAAEAEEAIGAAFDEVARVERPLSEWREDSEISALNRAAGDGPVAVGRELLDVLSRARQISELTGGAFDVTFAACGSLWSIPERRIPTESQLAACRPHVGWRKLLIDAAKGTAVLSERGMRAGIAGIAKGYGIDRAAEVLEAHGISSYFVDGGGDIRLRSSPGRRPWRVGIAHPRRPGKLLGTIELRQGAVVTSGDYLQYFVRDGVRYHHILDPRTGRVARASVAVTVIARDAMTADALATGLFVMGPERGLDLVESLPDVEALFVAPDLSVHASSGFPELESGG
ncbi:MAG: FAD:protein FMN transferase [Acidobacteria bacterium]|nr:MAG: FAD:protein FMN transferase [Acidobacteriota bacterium]